ncbi:hypothetical protein GCM10022419_117710 [Nonomuraea rosea]|uniref:Uncharacterized protein n=1 Tax=Nonomuraea rosea TaxID=638574 RepID=A0ABP6ZPW1_9ACTN
MPYRDWQNVWKVAPDVAALVRVRPGRRRAETGEPDGERTQCPVPACDLQIPRAEGPRRTPPSCRGLSRRRTQVRHPFTVDGTIRAAAKYPQVAAAAATDSSWC